MDAPAKDATMGRLTRRPQFLRVAERGRRFAAPGMVIQAFKPVDDAARADDIRLGLTASKKVGNAVVRNRARRRLRALARAVLALHGAPGHDYVLVARGDTATRPWPGLVQDIEAALRKLGHWR